MDKIYKDKVYKKVFKSIRSGNKKDHQAIDKICKISKKFAKFKHFKKLVNAAYKK